MTVPSFAVTPPLQGSYTSQTYERSPRSRGQLAPNSYTSLTTRRPRTIPWIRHIYPQQTHFVAYRDNYSPKSILGKVDPHTKKTLNNAKHLASKSYWTQQRKTVDKKERTNGQIKPQVIRDVRWSPRPKTTVKKATLSSNPRWTRNQGDHKKKKKQFIVANWGGLGLGNGLTLGLSTPAATYGAGLGAGYGTSASTGFSAGLTSDYAGGLGTMLTPVYGSQETNGVLDTRQTFGTNYGATTGNSQSSPEMSDLSAAGLNSLTSQAGLNYLSSLAGGGGGTDLNSLKSISQYQNSDFDVLGNNANTASMRANQLSSNTGLEGLDSLTGGTAQSQQYAENGNLGNSLEGNPNVGGGSRQGIGGCKFC